jgi:hypothetical protein
MENDTVKQLKDFNDWVESYCKENNIPEYEYTKEHRDILMLSSEDLNNLAAVETYAYAAILMNYAGHLQKKLDIVQSQLYWCNQALEYLFAKYWNNYDKSMPWEIKKKSILIDNSYAESVEKSRIRLEAAVYCLGESCRDIKKRVNILQDMGKAKAFK